MTLTTPTSCAGNHPQGGKELLLEGIQVGLSISNSPDLAQFGMGPPHLKDAMLELARYLLARGARLEKHWGQSLNSELYLPFVALFPID